MTSPTVHQLTERAVYAEHDPVLERRIWGRRVDPALDTELVHHWMHKPHVAEFWAMAWPAEWIADYLQRHYEDPHRTAYIGFVDDEPVGYMEVYDPAHDVLGAHVEVQPGDLAAHVLIGDEDQLGRVSVAMGMACNRFLFRDQAVQRILGEPDVRNHNFLSLLAFLGYRRQGEIDLPDKRAAFMVCRRRDFMRLSARNRVETLR
jgi:acetyl CoA:N6-hydroxylysine acetyl transferase